MAVVLYVGNRNYSSWSLRAWLALSWSGLEFETKLLPLGGAGYGKRRLPHVLAVSPTGAVPVLHDGTEIIADSLAIAEWAAERKPGLWPADAAARAQARAAACEMHSGFGALRANLPCNIRRRAEARSLNEAAEREFARMQEAWQQLRERFGAAGPYLFGATPTIADAFYTPIATRFRTYGVRLAPENQRYADALLANPAFRTWEAEAEREGLAMPEWDNA